MGLIFIFLLVIPFCKAAHDKSSVWKRLISTFKKYNAKELIDLDLSNDNFWRNKDYIWKHRFELRSLSLANAGVRNFGYDMPNLRYLDLNNNGILSLSELFFRGICCPELVELNLSNNKIKHVDTMALWLMSKRPCLKLQVIDLSGNPLDEQSIGSLERFAKQRGIKLITGELRDSTIKCASMKH